VSAKANNKKLDSIHHSVRFVPTGIMSRRCVKKAQADKDLLTAVYPKPGPK